MNRITAFLDWLDNAAGGLIRLAYLLAGITAIAVYFGAGSLPAQVEEPLNAALPWSLAFAVETHTYLSARRARAAWQEKDAGALRVNLVILAGLLAFSAWNQLGYLSETWHPPVNGVLALPGWLAYAVRALVVPAAFMAAAFLAPMAEPIAAQIETEARSVLADVFRIARKQRRKMLAEAEKSGRDMTGALVELVPDAEVRRIISHAYGAIGAPVARDARDAREALVQLPVQPMAHRTDVHETEPPTHPTGPGSPKVAHASKRTRAGTAPREPLRLPAPRRDAETRIRAVLEANPGISIRALAKSANVSQGSASKHRRIWLAEQEHSASEEAAQ